MFSMMSFYLMIYESANMMMSKTILQRYLDTFSRSISYSQKKPYLLMIERIIVFWQKRHELK